MAQLVQNLPVFSLSVSLIQRLEFLLPQEKSKRFLWSKDFIHMYENKTMKPVEIF
jgi:hypothetical protein